MEIYFFRLRNAVVTELISHPTIYKDIIDNSNENLFNFREYVKSIEDGSFVSGEVYECNFVLMAFVNITRLKMVILRPHSCSFVFTPLCEGSESLTVSYLKHIPPRDYISVMPLEGATDEQVSNQGHFLNSTEFSKLVQEKALKSWRSSGYKNYLETLKSLLPKYLTGTEDVLDKIDGSPINRPVMSHLTLLEDVGFGGDVNDEEEVDEETKGDEGSIIITS